jgi:hypothetical protein
MRGSVPRGQLLPARLQPAHALPRWAFWLRNGRLQPCVHGRLRPRLLLPRGLRQRHAGDLPCRKLLPPGERHAAAAHVPQWGLLPRGLRRARRVPLRALLSPRHQLAQHVPRRLFLPRQHILAHHMRCGLPVPSEHVQRHGHAVHPRAFLSQRQRRGLLVPRGVLLSLGHHAGDYVPRRLRVSRRELLAHALCSGLFLPLGLRQHHRVRMPTREFLPRGRWRAHALLAARRALRKCPRGVNCRARRVDLDVRRGFLWRTCDAIVLAYHGRVPRRRHHLLRLRLREARAARKRRRAAAAA